MKAYERRLRPYETATAELPKASCFDHRQERLQVDYHGGAYSVVGNYPDDGTG